MKSFNPYISLNKEFTMGIFGKACDEKIKFLKSLLPILHSNGFETPQYISNLDDIFENEIEHSETRRKIFIIDDSLGKISFSTLCQILRDCECQHISVIMMCQDIFDNPNLEFLFDFFIIFLKRNMYYPKWMILYLDDFFKKGEYSKIIVIDTDENQTYIINE